MATFQWDIRNYNLAGVSVNAADMTPAATVSNQVKHSTDRQLSFSLNGIDQLNFTLYLNDPMALQISRLHTIIKLWRTVLDDDGSTIYADPSGTPCFAGVVTNVVKNGEANTMTVSVMSPLWRLQCRFHILNHYLNINPDTTNPYTESELIWKLIDLINNAFGLSVSNTGIAEGTFSAGTEISPAPFFVQRGSNTWTNIYDGIMARASSIDIVPEYTHTISDPTLMIFNTDEKRGADLSASIDFRYHTGTGDVLDNLEEEETPIPNEFANYVWAVGHGGPNSGKIARAENVSDDVDGQTTIGIYMRRADFEDETLIGVEAPFPTHLILDAESELDQSRIPKKAYTATLAPAADIYYNNNYGVGDVVMVNANKGALVVTDVPQRIYEVTISNSDNNVETVTASLADDFTGKVVS